MSRASVAADKARVDAAIGAYEDRYGYKLPMSDLRSFIHSETGLDFGGPAIAAMLKKRGYIRQGEGPIDACPGRTVFYVLGSRARTDNPAPEVAK